MNVVGIENFLQICKMYGGSSIYIPVYSKMIMGDRNRRMVRDYNGKNIDRLRVRYDLSKEQVKYVLRKEGAIG